MILNHLNLAVEDVDAAEAFLRKHFALEPVGRRTSAMAGLRDDAGFMLVLMRGTPADARTLHVGFYVDSTETVDTIHSRLVADGINAPAPRRMHGSWAFYFNAPGGFLVEIAH